MVPARVPLLLSKIEKGTFSFVSLESLSLTPSPLVLPLPSCGNSPLCPSPSFRFPSPSAFFIDGAGFFFLFLLKHVCVSRNMQRKATDHTSVPGTSCSMKMTHGKTMRSLQPIKAHCYPELLYLYPKYARWGKKV